MTDATRRYRERANRQMEAARERLELEHIEQQLVVRGIAFKREGLVFRFTDLNDLLTARECIPLLNKYTCRAGFPKE